MRQRSTGGNGRRTLPGLRAASACAAAAVRRCRPPTLRIAHTAVPASKTADLLAPFLSCKASLSSPLVAQGRGGRANVPCTVVRTTGSGWLLPVSAEPLRQPDSLIPLCLPLSPRACNRAAPMRTRQTAVADRRLLQAGNCWGRCEQRESNPSPQISPMKRGSRWGGGLRWGQFSNLVPATHPYVAAKPGAASSTLPPKAHHRSLSNVHSN
eukprot:360252-Chlamydomonas_euryale.AAC.10